jgi:hypothetical protein
MQLQGMVVMMGALLGTTHSVLALYTTFLRKYNVMEPRVHLEFELVYGARLAPPHGVPRADAVVKFAARTNQQ